MPSAEESPFTLFIIGPTAVGKTWLSIRLAEALDGEIISADSRLFYRGMDIGTDKPTFADRERVPHHLIDIAAPDEAITLADFQAKAKEIIRDVSERKRLPLVVGGTGQYFRALTEGWQIPRQEPDPALRRKLEDLAAVGGSEALLEQLKRVDPAGAEAIDPRNTRRLVRALEVSYLTGRPFSGQRLREEPFLAPFIVGLSRPREDLYRRIDERIHDMITGGLIEEVRSLLETGYSRQLPSMSAIGYQEIASYLEDEINLEDAVARMKRRSRQLVRRQANWFKPDDPQIRWFSAEPDPVPQITITVKEALLRL